MRKLLAALLLVGLTTACREPLEPQQLDLVDAVVVVNEFTSFRVNLAVSGRDNLPFVTIPGQAASEDYWANLDHDDLLTLFSDVEGYSIRYASGVYRLDPIGEQLPADFGILDDELGDLKFEDLHFFRALQRVCQAVGGQNQQIEIVHPIIVTSDSLPKLDLDYPHWERTKIPRPVTLDCSGMSVHMVIDKLLEQMPGGYWIASLLPPESVSNVPANVLHLDIELHHAGEHLGSRILHSLIR